MIRRLPYTFAKTKPLLHGIGQVMLQRNALTGLLFLAGICCGSWQMGLAALVAVVAGTSAARLLRYDKDETDSGLYGFSAVLVGVAFIFLFGPGQSTWLALLAGSVLATVIQHVFIVKKIPVFTFPFILVTWLFLAIAHYFPGRLPLRPVDSNMYTHNVLSLFARGFGQVIFQDHIAAGLLFFAGILVSRPLAALYAAGAILLSALLAACLQQPATDIYAGLLSYNAVLCALVFAGRSKRDFLRASIAVVLSVLIMIAMRRLQLPALTFPFVAATWITLFLKNKKPKDPLGLTL